MKILITGITGLLGSYLARELVALGEIHGLRREGSDMRLLGELERTIHWHTGNVNDYQSLEKAFEGTDIIVHAAGLVSFLSKDKDRLLKTNVEGTANVVNVMLEKKVKKLVYISSVAALGRDPETNHISEDYKWNSSAHNTSYAISKHLGELEVWRGNQEGLDVLVFNPSVLLAKASDQRSSASIYDYVLRGNRFYPKGNINYIDIRDACRIISGVIAMGKWNDRYILNRESISYKRFFDAVADAFGVSAPNIRTPDGLLAVALFFSRVFQAIGNKGLPINKQAARIAQSRITFENKKIKELLDVNFTDLKDTLQWATGNESEPETV